MNLRTIFCRFSGLIFCLVLFSLAQNVNSEVTINVGSLCYKHNGTITFEDINSAIVEYDEHWPFDCEILIVSRSRQSVVISFYEWDLTENDELVFKDGYTELSLKGTREWYGEKTFIFKGDTRIQLYTNDTVFKSLLSSKFKFLFTLSNGEYPRCDKDDFKCNNKICLSDHHLVCDENNNCGDWSDEIDCERMCTSDEFECTNHKCIPKYKLCDDRNDCGDMSDEEMCNRYCRQGDQFKCSNSMCILNHKVCDKKNDCGDWSDEINCHRECDSFQFPCRNKRCIDSWKVCDGNDDCGDRSDEKNCRYCSSLEFSCSNSLCIPKNLVCNNRNDCGDSSDEKHCNTAKRDNADQTKVTVVQFRNPWLITILVCAVVLAIVIITFVGIYLRNRLKNKKEPPTTQPPNVPSNTNAQNAQPSNMFGRVSQPLRSERQSVPSSIQQPPAVPDSQAYQVPSMYPQPHSDTVNRDARQVQPTNFIQRVRQSFRSEHQPTPSTVQPPGHTAPTSVASRPQTYQVPSMYPHLQSGVDNPEFKAEE